MAWFQSPLVWSQKEDADTDWGLQMPLGVPIAAGVLAFLALLALVCHYLKEVWKSKLRLCCAGWSCLHPGKSLQLVSIHSPDEGQLGIHSAEPSGPQLLSPTVPRGSQRHLQL